MGKYPHHNHKMVKKQKTKYNLENMKVGATHTFLTNNALVRTIRFFIDNPDAEVTSEYLTKITKSRSGMSQSLKFLEKVGAINRKRGNRMIINSLNKESELVNQYREIIEAL